jgi:hypothetical protein
MWQFGAIFLIKTFVQVTWHFDLSPQCKNSPQKETLVENHHNYCMLQFENFHNSYDNTIVNNYRYEITITLL